MVPFFECTSFAFSLLLTPLRLSPPATLNVVANVDAVDSDTSGLTTERFLSSTRSNGTSTSDSGSVTESNRSEGTKFVQKLFDPLWGLSIGRNHTVVEDATSRLVTKHIFSKMLVEAGDHPFFKRVWLARHVLDENSPIVKPRVRRQIRKSGGSWPDRLNSHAAIRESLKFNQILVSLNGVSNVSASDVYAQSKSYRCTPASVHASKRKRTHSFHSPRRDL